jgi:hypothetical protein
MSLVSVLGLQLMLLTASPKINIEFKGPLSEVLKVVAQKGGMNVVVAGDVSEIVQIHLNNLTAEEAIESLATAYKLDVEKQGKLWIVRGREEDDEHDGVSMPGVVSAGDDDEASPKTKADLIRDQAELLRNKAEAARDRAEALREQAQELEEAQQERAEAAREAAQAIEEATREQERNGGSDDGDRVRTGRGEVRVRSGEVAESAVSYGGPVIIEHDAVLNGDAVAMGGDVVVEDNAVVNGDAVAMGGQVRVAKNGIVNGERVSSDDFANAFFAGKRFGRMMHGRRECHGNSAHCKNGVFTSKFISDDDADDGDGFAGAVGKFLLKFAGLFSLGFVLLMLAPKRLRGIESAVRQNPVLNGALGAFGLTVSFGLCLLLCFTIIGAPVGLVLGMLSLLMLPVGLAVIANMLGAMLPTGRLRRTQALVLAVGALLVVAIGSIPVLGPLATSLAALVAVGAILRTRFGGYDMAQTAAVEQLNVPYVTP